MHPKSMFSIRHWSLLEILFVASACFALAAAGFFVAVFIQLHGTQSSSTAADTKALTSALTVDQKAKIAAALATSTEESSSTPAALQAAQKGDTNERLKIMQALSAH